MIRPARVAWGLPVVAFSALVIAVVNGSRVNSLGLTEWDSEQTVSLASVIWASSVTSVSLVGAVIAARHPRNPIGWIFCAVGTALPTGLAIQTYATLAQHTAAPQLPVPLIWVGAQIVFPAFTLVPLTLLLFPDGRPPSRRWRPLLWLALANAALGTIALGFMPGEFPGVVGVRNPYGIERARPVLQVIDGGIGFIVLGITLASAASIVPRIRRARGPERQQLHVLAVGVGVLVTMLALAMVSDAAGGPTAIFSLCLAVGILAIPVSIGVAITRYRLYDIDRLIGRTVSYAILSAILVLVYAAGVVVLQALLRPIAPDSGVAVAGSTLAVAMAFSPLRRRLQSAVDRRFARARYDAAQTIASFGSRLRDQIELEAVADELLDVARRTMQPAHASVWVRPPG
ncbi:MAG TPA: hypothetical protein VM840_10855 [Actinomycetota bacterium]|nr:hypothetical protein [Actinomycetota bacterium]